MYYTVGEIIHTGSVREARQLAKELYSRGYYGDQRKDSDGGYSVRIYAWLPPAIKDGEGYFVEDDALKQHIEYEQASAGITGHFFMTDAERGDSENCLQFAGEAWDGKTFWGEDKLYITPGLLLYTNLEKAIRSVIPDFDIYGCDYMLSAEQWKKITEIANHRGGSLSLAVSELEKWAGANQILTIISI